MFDAGRYLPLSRLQPPWSAGIAERFHELWPVLQFPLPRLQHLLPRLLILLLCYCSIFARIQTLLPLLLPSKFPSSSPRLTFFCPTTFGLSLGLENQDETKATKLCHFQRNRLEELAAPSSALFVKLCPELPWFKIIRNHSTPETNIASMQVTKKQKQHTNKQTNKTKDEITGDPDPNLSLDFFQPQRNGSNREKQETDLLSSSSSSSSSITLPPFPPFFLLLLSGLLQNNLAHKIHKSSIVHNKSKRKGGLICFAFLGGCGKWSTDYCGKMEFTRCFWKWPEAWHLCNSVDACCAACCCGFFFFFLLLGLFLGGQFVYGPSPPALAYHTIKQNSFLPSADSSPRLIWRLISAFAFSFFGDKTKIQCDWLIIERNFLVETNAPKS